jgi:hypothetical protein
MPQQVKREDPVLTMLRLNKTSGYNYRERRHADWDENYQLYRDKVVINRLTQRQSVNLPMMKLAVQTLLKDIDDMPVLHFENLDNDKEAEIFKNEYWKYTAEHNKMEIQDIIDKRQQFLYGRSFDQWQIVDGKVKMTVQDPEDILVDRYCDPSNLNLSRFLIHTNIFVPLKTLENNPAYDQEAVAKLKLWHASDQGLIKASDNDEKNKKLSDLGVSDIHDPILGETYVGLTLHFVYEGEGDKEQLYLYVECDDMEVLMKKPLDEVIGKTKDNYWKNHYPYVTWAGDIERQDFWSDGVGDIVRTPNKVLNSWFSQVVENRTLRNFGMHYYDSTIEGFVPQTFSPVPWGWYGVPGKPQDIMQKVDIPDLSESLDEMEFLIQMTEKATGATATQQGMQAQRQITLGEVQLALGEAKERVKGLSKFYTQAWKDRGEIFIKLVEAAGDKLEAVKIHKQGRNTSDIFTKEISPKDWMTKSGYQVKVWSQDEKKVQDMDSLQKLNAAKLTMPDNPKLDEVYKRKLVEFADLSPDEISQIMDYEKKKQENMISMGMGGPMGQPMPGQPPAQGQPQVRPPVQPRPQPQVNTMPQGGQIR